MIIEEIILIFVTNIHNLEIKDLFRYSPCVPIHTTSLIWIQIENNVL